MLEQHETRHNRRIPADRRERRDGPGMQSPFVQPPAPA
jgi:hypothetical protein